MPPPTLSEKDKDAKSVYRLLCKNVQIAKSRYPAVEYKAIREFAEMVREDIAYVNGLDDMPKLPD